MRLRSLSTSDPGIGAAWLVPLRWLLYLGLAGLVAWLHWALALHLPVGFLATLLAAGAASNVVLHAVLARGHRASAAMMSAMMSAAMLTDTALLTALFAVTGGPLNPFTALYLVHVVLATLVLPRALSRVQFAASFLAFASLFWVQGLTPPAGVVLPTHQELMRLHLGGMLVAFGACGAVLVAFMERVLRLLRLRDAELQAARAAAHRNEKLAALTTLAAGAAHELSNPLGTIAVIARELERSLSTSALGAPFLDDALLIRAEVERCRGILERMSTRSGEFKGEAETRFGVEAWLADACRGLPDARRVAVGRTPSPEPWIAGPRGALGQALRNLTQNALEASDGPVRFEVSAREGLVTVEVHDAGVGLSADVLERVGEPFFTTKPPGRGMGLGIFLARSLAEQLGGGFTLESSPGQGSVAKLWVPASAAGGRA